jgi:Arc/MetJ family transcription regulator
MLGCEFFQAEIDIMRISIVVDDNLMEQTLRATGLKTRREAVELGLRTL